MYIDKGSQINIGVCCACLAQWPHSAAIRPDRKDSETGIQNNSRSELHQLRSSLHITFCGAPLFKKSSIMSYFCKKRTIEDQLHVYKMSKNCSNQKHSKIGKGLQVQNKKISEQQYALFIKAIEQPVSGHLLPDVTLCYLMLPHVTSCYLMLPDVY